MIKLIIIKNDESYTIPYSTTNQYLVKFVEDLNKLYFHLTKEKPDIADQQSSSNTNPFFYFN